MKKFIVHTTALEVGLGAVLSQEHVERNTQFYVSHKLFPQVEHYTIRGEKKRTPNH